MFVPTKPQAMARERVREYFKTAGVTVRLIHAPVDQLKVWAKAPKLVDWLADPAFFAWFMDDFDPEVTRRVEIDANRRWLESLRDDSAAEEALRLKAVQELLKLDGAYPSKAPTVRFADKEIQDMTDEEAAAEVARLKSQDPSLS